MKKRKIILVDFDGTIHVYNGFKGEAVLDGDPIVDINGVHAFDFIRQLIDNNWAVQIFSSRGTSPAFYTALKEWFLKHGMEESYLSWITASNQKNDHDYILDDRANFDGMYPPIEFLNTFKPWYKRGPQ